MQRLSVRFPSALNVPVSLETTPHLLTYKGIPCSFDFESSTLDFRFHSKKFSPQSFTVLARELQTLHENGLVAFTVDKTLIMRDEKDCGEILLVDPIWDGDRFLPNFIIPACNMFDELRRRQDLVQALAAKKKFATLFALLSLKDFKDLANLVGSEQENAEIEEKIELVFELVSTRHDLNLVNIYTSGSQAV